MSDELDWTTVPDHPVSRGGCGDIYRCKLTDSTQVAIKTIHLYEDKEAKNQKVLKHTAHELYTWSKCRHINVEPLLGLILFRGQLGIVATWQINGNLPCYLQRHPEADRCRISLGVTAGIAHLHTKNVIHGDLKGANVLMSIEGVPRVADFGNAVLRDYTLKFSPTSTEGTFSTRWAAPELFEEGKHSFAADVYALGMTILEAITRKVPWSGKTDRCIMYSVMIKKETPERPRDDIPADSEHGDQLWMLLKRCWQFEPGARPSVHNVESALEEITMHGLQYRAPDQSFGSYS
ncbi:cytoplasmic tyrosine-protein kinase BMX [Ceratobasidium sp. AG-Ba]|nr:cytoplasmic tyrosine-protein kinase BMX [Ceratobasidium sp. AG-Ba]